MRTLLHLTDLHVAADGEPHHSGPGPLHALQTVLEEVGRSPLRPVAIVLSGDLADSGEPGAYGRLRAVLADATAALGSELIVCAGNHDDRAALRAAKLGATGEATGAAPIDHVVWLGELRVLVLDSSVPGRVRGELDDEQLAWAAAELRSPAAAGTVLVVHHPPIPSPIGLDVTRMARPERLAGLVGGTDVRIVLCGHSHHGSAGSIAGVPVWMGPALTAANDVLAPADTLRTRAMIGATRIDLGRGWTQANPIGFGGAVLSETSLLDIERRIVDNDGPLS